MRTIISISICFFIGIFSELLSQGQDLEELFNNIKIAKDIDADNERILPIIYNVNSIVGYLNMPSARVNRVGVTYLGASYHPPYHNFGANLQLYQAIELAVNYRVFKDVLEPVFGEWGFGDDADRMANIKFAFSPARSFNFNLPDLAVGFDDFYGSRRFYSMYVVGTQSLKKWNLELSLGWGQGRMHGYFGGIAFTPWRFSDTFMLKDITFFAEYDANDYKNHPDEHPDGREEKSKINIGFAWNLFDALQLKVSSLRGNNWAASAGVFYNLGDSKGFLPKTQDPPFYSSPVNHEALGPLRTDKELAYEMALAFGKQGLNVARIYLSYDDSGRKVMWIRLINLRYLMNRDARERIQNILAALVPEDIYSITVALEEGSLIVQAYTYLTRDLIAYQKGDISESEMRILAPIEEVHLEPSEFDAALLFKRNKTLWSFLIRPRLLSFFGSTTGKYKYALGLIGGPQGYLFDSLYYKMQLSYNILSSHQDVGDTDIYNPSQMLNVRSDSINYFKGNTVSLEKLYIQKGWNFGKGVFFRMAGGYFESAYAGVASEALLYPVNANWAVGLEAATVLKREYDGLGFQYKIRKLNNTTPTYVPFVGYQYFLDYYYYVKPLDIGVKLCAGQFLARDRGVKLTLTRYFPSGVQFAFWITYTNAQDMINHRVYHDKGIAFVIPFDFFLHKNSRATLGYGMSFWLRDQGAQAATGKPLYPTINNARLYN
ncbi:MAG: YjbH domain-containing protein [Simkaniaceae bacterium]|nr:YjbH domain-containing protein [Simkaniaceae bacterium]